MKIDNKQQITLRLDKHVVDFFRGTGKGYQTRINTVLKMFVEKHDPHRNKNPS